MTEQRLQPFSTPLHVYATFMFLLAGISSIQLQCSVNLTLLQTKARLGTDCTYKEPNESSSRRRTKNITQIMVLQKPTRRAQSRIQSEGTGHEDAGLVDKALRNCFVNDVARHPMKSTSMIGRVNAPQEEFLRYS